MYTPEQITGLTLHSLHSAVTATSEQARVFPHEFRAESTWLAEIQRDITKMNDTLGLHNDPESLFLHVWERNGDCQVQQGQKGLVDAISDIRDYAYSWKRDGYTYKYTIVVTDGVAIVQDWNDLIDAETVTDNVIELVRKS